MTPTVKRRILLIGLAGVCVVAFAFCWVPIRESLRFRRIRQRKFLVDNIQLQIDDLYLLPDHQRSHGGPDRDVLRVRCRYLGGDPNDKYCLRGALFASPDGPQLDYGGGYGQFAAADIGEGGIPMMWEFWKSPPLNSKFTMRIFAAAKDDPQRLRAEQHADFILTCLPKLTAHGETYLP